MVNRHTAALLITLLLLTAITWAQTEVLTNDQIIEMSKAGLGDDLIARKINSSRGKFDLSTAALIELKKAGVADAVIGLMLEKEEITAATKVPTEGPITDSNGGPANESAEFSKTPVTPKEALSNARSIALVKASLQPSRQALEKELMRRPQWKQFNLSIERYKEKADIFVEIGFVPMSWITHRYVYRIYDRRSGTVIAAGETTSWGSLAENLAKHIVKSLGSISKS